MSRKAIIVTLMLCVMGMALGNFLSSQNMTENNARKIANKFKPILQFHEDEKYFPVAIEWLGINWTTVPLGNSNATVNYNTTGPEELNEEAPVYASLLENQDGTLRISYAFLYGYNGCGPKLHAELNTNFGFNLDQKFSVCPLGLHWGDIERVTVNVAKDQKTVLNLNFAYHDGNLTVLPNEVTWKGPRPVVYVAMGSHASYHTKGEKEVMPLWNMTGKTFNTLGQVSEDVNNRGETWSSYNIRLLKFNGSPTKDITREESYLAFLFTGRLGLPISNKEFDYFQNEILAYANVIKSISPDAYQYAVGAIFMLSHEVHKNACYSLAGPGRENWW